MDNQLARQPLGAGDRVYWAGGWCLVTAVTGTERDGYLQPFELISLTQESGGAEIMVLRRETTAPTGAESRG